MKWPLSMRQVPVTETLRSKLRFSLFSEPGDSAVTSSEAVSCASEELTGVHPLTVSGESS